MPATRTTHSIEPLTTPPATPKSQTCCKHASKKNAATSGSALNTSNPSTSRLLNHTRQTTDDWYKSSRTKKGYARYVKSGKKWVFEWAGAQMEPDAQSSTDELEGLALAFDLLSKNTPLALRLLTAFKCDHNGKGFATAEGIWSAFKDYFERVLGCQGEFWKYNAHTNEWEGNPVFEADYRVYYELLKNRENRTGTSTQALPMLPKDLKILFDYLDSPEGRKKFTLTQQLYFKVFASTAFNLWTRNDELINFVFKDLKLALVSDNGICYIEFRLIFRKTNKDPTKVQIYRIPYDPDHPKFDCYTHMTAWISHLQTLLRFGENTSRSGIENLIESIVNASELMNGRRGKFTTHCFRCGGAQYRFMWADHKWSLKAVKWWGGWSSSENVGTIMRYLLDELMTYEEGFSDIMMTDRTLECHETFMGTRNPSRIPQANSLDDVVQYWETGNVERGLMTPLKDWERVFDLKDYKSEAVKLSNAQFVYEEFSGKYGSSYDDFEAAFPGL
ncbi:hypothetical protein BT96DRAFT_945947 [Gymnopus androsaceus JB14]|uniref:Uncharacterized protein n=1 Tax=Gymnopus androsaceus JB14 TaxID=1447944 RepID=A0A6A4GYY7_9AGAR|nr:hypothetical protein BT96DRAFT_945947 [Gymnopus androsaceus JB14]